MISCVQVQESLSLYIDDELSKDKKAAIAQHLKTCHSCQQEYMDIQITIAIRQALEPVKPPPGFRSRVEERLASVEKGNITPLFKRFSSIWVPLGAVAACVLIFFLSWSFLFKGGAPNMTVTEAGRTTPPIEESQPLQEEQEKEDIAIAQYQGKADETEKEAVKPEPVYVDDNKTDEYLDASVSNQNEKPVQTKKDRSSNRVSRNGQYGYSPANEGEHKAEEEKVVSLAMDSKARMTVKSVEGLSQEKLLQVASNVKENPQVLLTVETDNVKKATEKMENFAEEQGLKIKTTAEEEITKIDIYSPTPSQQKVINNLKKLGDVSEKETINFEIDETVQLLLDEQNRILQRQSELEALIANEDKKEKREDWQAEIRELIDYGKEIAEKTLQLEKIGATTIISLKLVPSI